MNWNEKYRPQTLDDIKGQDHVISRLKKLIEQIHEQNDGDMPNLFFSGMQGTGKNCAIDCFLKDCFGSSWESNLTPLNASDDRKIDTVRTKIKDAARRSVISTYTTEDGREKDMPFNLIFMDEADALTPDAQGALRRIIEEYSHITRFVFCCNYDYKIIDPIKSRCMTFRFKRIKPEDMKEILQPIIEKERITISPEALDILCRVSGGDARKAQNILQNASLGGTEITEEIIGNVAGDFTHEINLDLILEYIATSPEDPSWGSKFDKVWEYLEHLYWDKSLDTKEIIYAVMNSVKESDIPQNIKREMIIGAAGAMYRCSVDNNIVHVMAWFSDVE